MLKRRIQRLIVATLETACGVIDRLYDWPAPFSWLAALFGPCRLADWSFTLDLRWRTGWWCGTAETDSHT